MLCEKEKKMLYVDFHPIVVYYYFDDCACSLLGKSIIVGAFFPIL